MVLLELSLRAFYNALGVKVTVVELADRILPVEDAEISKIAEKEFFDLGIDIRTNSTIKSSKIVKDKIEFEIENQSNNKTEKLSFDRVISAIGIVPNSENIGLEGTRIKTDRGHIVTDENCQTDEPGIYAIGDVASAPWLAHKASHEGINAVEHIAGMHVHSLQKENIPGCTYSSPEVASVGLSEEKAKEKVQLKLVDFLSWEMVRLSASGKESGLIKVIFSEETGELLGAHMIGYGVTELIQGFVLAKTFEATEEDIMRTCFPHPTLSEMMHEAVLDADNRALHI